MNDSKSKLTAVGADANQQPTTGFHFKDKEATPMNSTTGLIARESIAAAAKEVSFAFELEGTTGHNLADSLVKHALDTDVSTESLLEQAETLYGHAVGRGGRSEFTCWTLNLLVHMRLRQIEAGLIADGPQDLPVGLDEETRTQLAKLYRRTDTLAADLVQSVAQCTGPDDYFAKLVDACLVNIGKGLADTLLVRVRDAIPYDRMLASHSDEVSHLLEEMHTTLEQADGLMAGHVRRNGGGILWV
ncbi:MAG: hypothetical protein HWE20_14675 [Gammaproteobacteria bacterium]|nr:hypothetical protein [Gammaproteobacteria bacterium]